MFKKLFAITTLGLSTSVLGVVLDYPDVNPEVVGKIIMESELVYCSDNVCTYFDRPGVQLPNDQDLPNGYIIVFPVDMFTPEEIESSKSAVMDFYREFIQ